MTSKIQKGWGDCSCCILQCLEMWCWKKKRVEFYKLLECVSSFLDQIIVRLQNQTWWINTRIPEKEMKNILTVTSQIVQIEEPSIHDQKIYSLILNDPIYCLLRSSNIMWFSEQFLFSKYHNNINGIFGIFLGKKYWFARHSNLLLLERDRIFILSVMLFKEGGRRHRTQPYVGIEQQFSFLNKFILLLHIHKKMTGFPFIFLLPFLF